MQQVAVHLGLDEDEVDEQHDEVVLDVLVAEPAAVLAHRQPDIVPARRVARPLVLRPERLHRRPALDADRHFPPRSFGFGFDFELPPFLTSDWIVYSDWGKRAGVRRRPEMVL